MIAIGLTTFFLIITFLLLLSFSLPRWANFRSRLKNRLILLGSFHVLLAILLAYSAWPLSSNGLAQREEAVDAFLNAMSVGNAQTALNMIPPASDEEFASIQQALTTNPQNQPIAWEMTKSNTTNIALGTITFPDNGVRDVSIFLEWEWEKARWGVSGFRLGGERNESELRFILPSTFLPYSWFRLTIIFVSVFCILFTVWQVWQLRRQ